MEIYTFCVSVILLFVAFTVLRKWHDKYRNLGSPLPGPSFFEGFKTFIKGNRDYKLHLYLTEWAEKFGPIFQIDLIIRKVVFVNDAETFRRFVKDVHLRDFTNDRPPTFIGKMICNGNKDIVLAPLGPQHYKKRKLFHQILKFYGEGRNHFEELMITTLRDLTKEFGKFEKVKLSTSLKSYILSLVAFLLNGDISETAKINTTKIEALSDIIAKMTVFENETFLQPFPFLRFVPGLRFKALNDSLVTAYNNCLETYYFDVKKTFDPSHKRGMVDELLSYQFEDSSENTYIDEESIKAITTDIVSAGYITTSSSLSSMFLYLIKHQDIQARVYEEIRKVIGNSTPSFQHKQRMPYTEAVITETLRISSSAPLLVPHMINQDITFDGYFIPKSTILMMNAWHNHHRKDYWDDPFAFKPERFLDEKGNLLESTHPIRQTLIAFGTGRRSCPGETFAKSRMFLITVFLLQRFQFLPDDDGNLPSSNPADWPSSFILCPDDFRCKIKPREV